MRVVVCTIVHHPADARIYHRQIRALLDAGHEVIGTHTSPSSGERVRALGAKPVLLDLLDARAVRKAVVEAEPEAIVHEAMHQWDGQMFGALRAAAPNATVPRDLSHALGSRIAAVARRRERAEC